MIIYHGDLQIDSLDKVDLAKAMYDFWLFQYRTTLDEYSHKKGLYHGAINANKSYERERENEQDDWGGIGFGQFHNNNYPYSDKEIERLKKDTEKSDLEVKEARAMLNFFIDHFIEDSLSNQEKKEGRNDKA